MVKLFLNIIILEKISQKKHQTSPTRITKTHSYTILSPSFDNLSDFPTSTKGPRDTNKLSYPLDKKRGSKFLGNKF